MKVVKFLLIGMKYRPKLFGRGGNIMSDRFLKDIKLAWNKFVIEGKVESVVDPIIERSWKRCKKNKVDYKAGYGKLGGKNTIEGLMKKNKELLRIARPIMENLNSLVLGTGFILVLTDNQGYIIETIGEVIVKEEANLLNFCIGSLWTEEEVGTNAIGTCIKENKPIQVIGAEHYCEYHHTWTCSSAPIYDSEENLIGVLNMSGNCNSAHRHTLGIVVAAAYSIENEISLLRSHELVDTTLESISDGMIIVDDLYKINKMNNIAEKILGLEKEEYCGMDIRNILRDVSFDNIVSMKTKVLEYVDCDFITPNKRIACSAKISPIKTDRLLIGFVILFKEIRYLHNTVNVIAGNKAIYSFEDILTENDSMKRAIKNAKKFARTSGCILIEGESGTGKELFAHSIHNYSSRKEGPFLAVNCASLPRDLVESELFGYEKGTFTGALTEGKPGKFELANGGTIFLDEIGELPLDLQAKLLRVLDDYTITRIGGKYSKKLDIRVIVATNRDLYEEIKKDNFREDLYYRLNVFSIKIPPLRERIDDVKVCMEYFLGKLNQVNFTSKEISEDFLYYAKKYSWKGNVRELENIIERSYYLSDGDLITKDYLPDEILNLEPPFEEVPIDNRVLSIDEAERKTIINALIASRGNAIEASKTLNVSKSTIYRKINKHNIDIDLFK